jgi:tetratricopeptide (TPR) repeat protein
VGTRPDSPTDVLRRRAHRAKCKGDHRKAIVALRELVAITGDAKSWTLLGDSLRRARKPGEAIGALKQALWLHRRAGASLRARTVARMLVDLDPHDDKHVRFA